MFLRKLLVLVFILSCGATCAMAQDTYADKIEITPFGGAKFGGKINVTGYTSNANVDNVFIKSGIDYGVIADYSIWDSFAVEFMMVRQPTTYSEQDFTTIPPTKDFLANGTLGTYTFGGAYTFRSGSNIRPFVAGGVGWTNFGNLDSQPTKLYVGFNNKVAYNLGGGVKYYFSKYLGLRFDMRWMASRTTPNQSTYCSGYYGCGTYAGSYKANQGEANLGLILHF
ncbi:MAG TPA: hypothetical protein VGR81_09555 [Candidatus Acidoferrales bacterium]|nr:hypothetical protein [Candidatus Acidoferrales bacterium]